VGAPDAVIHPLGNREHGIQTSNFTTLAKQFLNKIGRGGDMDDLEKIEYWLYQGSGQLCDGCKVMVEEMQRTVLAVSSAKIKDGDTQDKKFVGGGGHQIVMDDKVKEGIRSLWRNPGYYEVNQYLRDWAKDTINGPRSADIFSTLTAGAFSMDDLIARKGAICSGILRVCPRKTREPVSQKMSSCRACVEGFQDFQHMLLRDRRDIEIGKMDRGAFKKPQKSKKQFCSKGHVYYRLQELMDHLPQYHPTQSVSKIQEVVESIIEEHESDVIQAFVEGCKESIGSGAKAVCTDIAEMCDNDEFDLELEKSQSYHMPTEFPRTHGLDVDYKKRQRQPEVEL